MTAAAPAWSVIEVREALAGLDDQDRALLLAALSKRKGRWYSLPGPQSEARYSEADITGYGGAAGGGKTDLAVGLAVEDHEKSTIFRRETSQLIPVVERLEEVLGSRNGFNGQSNVWKLGAGRRVRLGGFPNLGDEKRHQGSGNDLVVFDEAAEMLEAQVRFIIGWNRSPKRKQRCRILLTFNPPTTPEGRWVIKYFGPWLDKRFAGPGGKAAPGELRWVTTIAGEDRWMPDGRAFVLVNGQVVYDFDPSAHRKEDILKPMSRTFIPARVVDNPFLADGEYMSRLQAHPEPLRSQMLYGDFEAGMEDDAWQVIPTAWVRASMARWLAQGSLSAAFRKPCAMESMGVDVAMGGRDKFVISRRHGRWYDELIRYPGREVKSGAVGAGLVIQHRRDRSPVHVDIVGWGADTHGALVSNGVQTIAINGANSSPITNKAGQRFANKRAELIWSLREALDPDGADPIDLPDDPQLELDLTSYRWTSTRGGILIRSKEEMKKELGHSPDDGDAVAYALVETLKEEVVIDAIERLGYGGDNYDRFAELAE